MEILAVHFKIGYTDGRIFEFALFTEDVIKMDLIESTCLVYLHGSSERSRNNTRGGSLGGISQKRNCTWKS